MSHQRNPSDGLNVGEGFPTSYSSFAITADGRSEEERRPSSALRERDSRRAKIAARKRRLSTSPPPLVPLEFSRLQGASNSLQASVKRSPTIAFENSPKLTTTKKKSQSLFEEFRKRWFFVAFFLIFSGLVGFGMLLPVARNASMRAGSGKIQLARATRSSVPVVSPTPPASRFARWAAALFGPASDVYPHPIAFSAGLGDLDLPEVASANTDNEERDVNDDVVHAEVAGGSGRRAGKRRKADDHNRDEREHPSRAQRREKQLESLNQEIAAREKAMAKRRQLRNQVMAKVAKAFKAAGSAMAMAGDGEEHPGKPVNVPTVYQAAHPEEEEDFVEEVEV